MPAEEAWRTVRPPVTQVAKVIPEVRSGCRLNPTYEPTIEYAKNESVAATAVFELNV